ncbi:MAG: hypothetical protein WA982_17385, partial [Rubrobacteraceae bacterium]
VSFTSILINEGFFFFVFFGIGASAIATFVLLVAALRWGSNSTGRLIRIYAVSLGILVIVGGLIGLAMLALEVFAPGSTFTSVAILVIITIAGSLLLAGTLLWEKQYARILRVGSWIVLLASCIPLISFAAFFLPLIIGVTPALAKR